MMQAADPQRNEDGLQLLRDHATEHTDELIAEFERDENDHGLRCWLLELADLIAAERVVGRILAGPGAGSGGFHVADELVFQSVPGSVRGSPNRGITLAPKPVTAVMRSSAIVTTSSP